MPPRPRIAEVDIGPGADVWTEDLQVVVALPAGSVDAPAVEVAIVPLDPATLPALPDGRVANGNAYRIALASVPEREAIESPLDPAGQVVMRAPHEAESILFSADGREWTALETRPDGDGAYEAPFARAGVYLAVADHVIDGGEGGAAGAVGAVVVAAIAATLVGAFVLGSRRRRRLHDRPRPA